MSGLDLEAPLFIALYQTVITALICAGKLALARAFPQRFSFQETSVFGSQTMRTVSVFLTLCLYLPVLYKKVLL